MSFWNLSRFTICEFEGYHLTLDDNLITAENINTYKWRVWGLVFASIKGSLLLIYDKLSSEPFSNTIKTVKCNKSLAIAGDVKGTTLDKMYHNYN